MRARGHFILLALAAFAADGRAIAARKAPAAPARAATRPLTPFPPPQNPSLPPAHCAILVRQMKRSGVTEVIAFRSALRSRSECGTLATLHERNFQPDEVLAKKVSYSWLGPSDAAEKRVALRVARRQGKKALTARPRRARGAY